MASRKSLRIAKDGQISELMRNIKYLIGQGMLHKVHTLLLERENYVQNELEKLRTDLVLVESEKLKCREELESLKDNLILKDKEDEIKLKCREELKSLYRSQILKEADEQASGLSQEINQHKEQLYRSNQLVEDYLAKLSEMEKEKRISEEKVESMRSKIVDVDSLNMNLQNLESEVKKFKQDKATYVQSMDDMRQQRVKDLQIVEELRMQLVEETKRKASEVDYLTEKMQNLTSEIQKFKGEKLRDVQTIEAMERQKLEESERVKGLKKDLIEAGIAKTMSDETISEMTRKQMQEVNYLNTKLEETKKEVNILKAKELLDAQTINDLIGQQMVDSQMMEEFRRQLLECEVDKGKSDITIGKLKLKLAEVDHLNAKLIEMGSEIETYKREKISDAHVMEDLRSQQMNDSQNMELKRELLRVSLEKKNAGEMMEEMRREKVLEKCFLNAKLKEMVYEIQTLKGEKLVHAQSLEKLRVRNLNVVKEKKKSDETIDRLTVKLKEMETIIKASNEEKMLNAQTVVELKSQLMQCDIEKSKTDKTIEELKIQNLKAWETVEVLNGESLKRNQTIMDLGIRLDDLEEIIQVERDSVVSWKLKYYKLEANQVSEVHTKNFPRDGSKLVQDLKNDNGRMISPTMVSGSMFPRSDDKNMVQAQEDYSRRMISPVPVSGSMLQSTDIIEISDSDGDETDHGRSTKASGLSITSLADERDMKVVSFTHTMSPCSNSSLKRKQNEDDKVGQSSKRQNLE